MTDRSFTHRIFGDPKPSWGERASLALARLAIFALGWGFGFIWAFLFTGSHAASAILAAVPGVLLVRHCQKHA